MAALGPCYRSICPGPMEEVDGIALCASCGLGSPLKDYISWLESGDYDDDPEDDFDGVPGYDPIYDDDGEEILCPMCLGVLTPLKLYFGKVVCPRCGYETDKEELKELFGISF